MEILSILNPCWEKKDWEDEDKHLVIVKTDILREYPIFYYFRLVEVMEKIGSIGAGFEKNLSCQSRVLRENSNNHINQ